MKNGNQTYVCENLNQVLVATEHLDKAAMLPLKVDDHGVIKDVEKYKGLYNISQGKFCTAVINHYNLVQHKEYIDGFAKSLSNLGVKYKMSFSQVGNKVYADIVFIGRNLKFDKLNEEFTTGIRLVNSYDKSTGLYAAPRFTRLACTNGMILTRTEKTLSIKHHSKILKEIEVFIQTRVREMIENDVMLQHWVSESMKDSIEWKIGCKIIEKMFSQPKHREEILKRLGLSMIIKKQKDNKAVEVEYVWDDESKKKEKLNRWDMYNAMTHYLTHGEQVSTFVEDYWQRRVQKVLMTPLAKLPLPKVGVLDGRKN